MPIPASASSTGRTVEARFPLKARATSWGASGVGEEARTDWMALTCSGRVTGHGMTLSGSVAVASPRSRVWVTGA